MKLIDPDHPTTTMVLYSRLGYFFSQLLLNDFDILSYNVFGRIYDFRQMLKWYLAKKPFLLSEWGINGPWEETHTIWNAPVENSSYIKSKQLIDQYQKMIPVNNEYHLGSLFFIGVKSLRPLQPGLMLIRLKALLQI